MSTRTKEEELALDEKIARIQRKNEEILRRQQEIEEDKRMAEQQNAIVKLRPSTTNVSRERTPALKPSNRELRPDTTKDFPLQESPPMQRSSRGIFRGRGGERLRGQGDWKASGGPPPDPRSFLYDDERDVPSKDNMEQKREPERGRREERDNSDNFRGGGREFQRGRRRGGMEYRGERGRRGGGGRRNEEEEWRAERMKIDEARIQRQRAADGRWRREWDSDKMLQDSDQEPIHEARKFNTPSQETWSPPSQLHGKSPPSQLHGKSPPSQFHGPFHTSPDRPRHPSRGGGIVSGGGRGRGRLDPAELEMPLEKFEVEVLQSQTSPGQRPSGVFTVGDKARQHSGGEVASPPSPHPPQDDFKLDLTRSVACIGNTVKISIPNKGAAQSTPKPQRQAHETRGRYKSQASYSSQSDEDAPRDRSYGRGRRQRSQKPTKGQDKIRYDHNNSADDQTLAKTSLETLPVQNKPPLPPFRAEQKPSADLKDPIEAKDGDESWEDVTTSGTESMGEEFSSVHSSPLRKTVVNTMIISGKQSEPLATGFIQTVEFSQPLEDLKNSYEEYLKELEMNEAKKKFESTSLGELEQQQINSGTSSLNISLDTSDNILLHESASEELVDQLKSLSVTTLDSVICLYSEDNTGNVPKEEITEKREDPFILLVQDETIPAKEECMEFTKDSALDSNGDSREKDIGFKEFECKGNAISEQTNPGHNMSEDSTAAGEAIQISSDNKAVLTNSQVMSYDSNTTDDVKADEKESQLSEATL